MVRGRSIRRELVQMRRRGAHDAEKRRCGARLATERPSISVESDWTPPRIERKRSTDLRTEQRKASTPVVNKRNQFKGK